MNYQFRNNEYSVCELCRNLRNHFYCEDCLRHGDFTHSDLRKIERLAEKRLRLILITRHSKNISDRIRLRLQVSQKENILAENTQLIRERIKKYKIIIVDHQNKIENIKKIISKIQLIIQTMYGRTPLFSSKVIMVEEILRQSQIRLDSEALKVHKCDHELSLLRKKKIEELSESIFPLERICSQTQSLSFDRSDEEDSLVNHLADASRMTFIHGRWIFEDQQESSDQFRIVESLLPSSGYYHHFSETQNSSTTSNDVELTNSLPYHCTISSGLTFAAQLLRQISIFLDTLLPHKILLDDFSSIDPSDNVTFVKKVAALNYNVVYLCVVFGIDVIYPLHTLVNIQSLITSNRILDIPRPLPSTFYQMSTKIFKEVEELKRTGAEESSDESDEDLKLIFGEDWEAISKFESPSMTTTIASYPMSTSNFVNSFFRGFSKGGINS